MSRKDASGFSDVLGAFLTEADPAYRISIPADLASSLPWLTGKAVPCRLFPGCGASIQVDAEHGAISARFQRIAELLTQQRAKADDVEEAWASAARLAAFSWEITISKDYRFTVPEGVRKVGLLPAEPKGNSLVLYANGGILEVWTVEEWMKNLQPVVGASTKRKAMLDAAIALLEQRAEV